MAERRNCLMGLQFKMKVCGEWCCDGYTEHYKCLHATGLNSEKRFIRRFKMFPSKKTFKIFFSAQHLRILKLKVTFIFPVLNSSIKFSNYRTFIIQKTISYSVIQLSYFIIQKIQSPMTEVQKYREYILQFLWSFTL